MKLPALRAVPQQPKIINSGLRLTLSTLSSRAGEAATPKVSEMVKLRDLTGGGLSGLDHSGLLLWRLGFSFYRSVHHHMC